MSTPDPTPDPDAPPPPTVTEDTFRPVNNYPGVATCARLCRMFLGVTNVLDLICCIECPRLVLLNLSTAHEHVKTHILDPKKRREFSDRNVREVCNRYKLFQGLLTEIPLPASPIPPYDFLPIIDGFLCLVCEEDQLVAVFRTEGTLRNHFGKYHKGLKSKTPGLTKPVKLQSFSKPADKNYRDFVVLPELASLPEIDESLQLDASPRDLFQALVQWYKPRSADRVEGLSLKDTQPFLWYSGWASHVSPHDVPSLRDLVKWPEPSSPYYGLLESTVREFLKDQAGLDKVHIVYRTAVLNDGTATSEDAFHSLQPEAAKDYARHWGLFVIFCVRLYEAQERGDKRYLIDFTPRQVEALRAAQRYCGPKEGRPRALRVLIVMARAFWLPETPSAFRHIEEDQYNEPTIRFAILSCLKDDGTFCSPRNAAKHLVRIKYFMRASMFMWSRWTMREVEGMEVNGQNWIVDSIAPALTRRAITPFASICVALSQATVYAATSVHIPNVTWTSATRVVVEGHPVEFPAYQKAVEDLVLSLEAHIFEEVLLGVTPEEADFHIHYDTQLYDNYSRTDPDYSFLTDERNPFIAMRFSLCREFFKTPRASFLYRGLQEDPEGGPNQVDWSPAGVDRWLSSCDQAVKQLGIALHATGGPPGRATEACILKLVNMGFRIRGFYFRHPGTIIFLLSYNKTTSNTGYDRLVAHAVPWRVGRLFLIMHALANPLVSLLVEWSYGPDARAIQETSVFALRGCEMKPEQMASALNQWLRDSLNLNIRLRVFRQVSIAWQKRFMSDAIGPIRDAECILDVMAGHTTQTAKLHYAIDTLDTHRLANDTVLKYLLAAQRWWSVILPPSLLEPEELEAAKLAPRMIDAINSGLPMAGQFFGHNALERSEPGAGTSTAVSSIVRELAKAIDPALLAGEIVDRFTKKFDAAFVQAASRGHSRSPETSTAVPVPTSSQSNTPSSSASSGRRSPENASDAAPNFPVALLGSLRMLNDLLGRLSAQPASSIPSNPHSLNPDAELEPVAPPYCPLRRFHAVPDIKHLVALRRFTGDPNSVWSCPGQGKAFAFAARRERSLLAVLPTGAGKSILFAGMHQVESGQGKTVVVFPLRALMDDQIRSMQRKGIPVVSWQAGLQAPNPCVVAVSVEHAALEYQFIDWCAREQAQGTLRRVVIDEAHLLCTSKHFRGAMDNMKNLIGIGVPLVALTATLPPSMEPELNAQLGHPSWAVVREHTQRRNISLYTAKYNCELDAMNSLVAHVRRYEQQLKPGEGILVMCRSRGDVEKVSSRLGCPSYMSQYKRDRRNTEDGDQEAKVREWIDGRFKTIVGTSALGTGINHPACRIVFHFNLPHGVVQWVQEFGRAGRDGERAAAFLLHWKPVPAPPEPHDDGGFQVLRDILDDVRLGLGLG